MSKGTAGIFSGWIVAIRHSPRNLARSLAGITHTNTHTLTRRYFVYDLATLLRLRAYNAGERYDG
jgi:hypothetical protein